MIQIKQYIVTEFLRITAFVGIFCISNIVQAERIVGSDVESQMIQLPTRANFKHSLQDAGFAEVLNKTGLVEMFYHNKESYQAANPISLDRFVQVINAVYDEYGIVEGHMPSRVSLVNRSKPLLYRTLLQNNPAALDELHDRGIL